MAFLLDTNIVVGVMTGRSEAAGAMLARHRRDIVLSSVVLHELLYGAYASERVDENLGRVERLGFPVLDMDGEDAKAAARIRAELRRQGNPIGPYDVLIAGQAMARGLILVTNNTREFSRVHGLRLEDWTVV